LLQGSLPKRENEGFLAAFRHEIWAACCSSFDCTASTTHKEYNCFVYLKYFLFSQLSDDIVFILFGTMSELHQFGSLGTSSCSGSTLKPPTGQTFQKKRQQKAPQGFKDL
jgi:hypothetical protein